MEGGGRKEEVEQGGKGRGTEGRSKKKRARIKKKEMR